MSDGLAHCRSISVVKIFEMIKQLSNVIFDIVIALRIGIHNLTHARAMNTAKIPFGHLQTFPYCEKSEIPRKCSYACAESIFSVYGTDIFFIFLGTVPIPVQLGKLALFSHQLGKMAPLDLYENTGWKSHAPIPRI